MMAKDEPRAGKTSAFGMGAALASTEPVLLHWKSSLLERRPKTFATGVAISVLALFILWFGFRDDPGIAGLLVIAMALVVGSLGPAFFPITYTLTPKRVQQKILFSLDSYRWSDFDHYFLIQDGVFVHLAPRDLRQKYLKGVTLYFSRGNRDKVLDIVRQFVPEKAAQSAEKQDQTKKHPSQEDTKAN